MAKAPGRRNNAQQVTQSLSQIGQDIERARQAAGDDPIAQQAVLQSSGLAQQLTDQYIQFRMAAEQGNLPEDQVGALRRTVQATGTSHPTA